MYSYTRGDPVNRLDPHGLADCGDNWVADASLSGPCSLNGLGIGWGYWGAQVAAAIAYWTSYAQQAAAAAAAAPSCSIKLFTRGVPVNGSPANHTYIEITDSATGTDETLEGGPTTPHNPIKNRKGSWGNLTGDISGTPGTLGGTAGHRLGGTNPANNTLIGSDSGGADVCAEAEGIDQDVRQYNKGPGVAYAPVPNGTTTFNSNSFTYTLLNQVGLASIFQPFIGWSPGWGFIVPGL
jgi:hypothetical protein